MAIPRQTFGEWVRDRRRQLGLTQRDIERAVGKGDGWASRIEKGARPGDDVLEPLARVLQVTLEEVLERAGRATDPASVEQRSLALLKQLVKEQRAGFERIEKALAKLSGT